MAADTVTNNTVKSIRNWNTTIFGFLAGVGTYLVGVGPQVPTNVQEWGVFALGLLVAGLGMAAKDGSTGSGPDATH